MQLACRVELGQLSSCGPTRKTDARLPSESAAVHAITSLTTTAPTAMPSSATGTDWPAA